MLEHNCSSGDNISEKNKYKNSTVRLIFRYYTTAKNCSDLEEVNSEWIIHKIKLCVEQDAGKVYADVNEILFR